MRLTFSHVLTIGIAAIVGWWLGRNVPMPGDEQG